MKDLAQPANSSPNVLAKHRSFDSMSDAFDYCREVNKPVVVVIAGSPENVWKLYPSGRASRQIRLDKDQRFELEAIVGSPEDEIFDAVAELIFDRDRYRQELKATGGAQ